MEAEIHAELTHCFLAPYCTGVSLTAYSPAMEIIVPGGGGHPGGQKCDIPSTCGTKTATRLLSLLCVCHAFTRMSQLPSLARLRCTQQLQYLPPLIRAFCCHKMVPGVHFVNHTCMTFAIHYLRFFDPQVQRGSLHLVRN